MKASAVIDLLERPVYGLAQVDRILGLKSGRIGSFASSDDGTTSRTLSPNRGDGPWFMAINVADVRELTI